MLFFKRILGVSDTVASTERRGDSRYVVGDSFPLKAVLNTIGRDEIGQPLQSKDGQGWDWTGHLVNLSVAGARMQVPPTMHSHQGDACRLKLEIEGYELIVPGTIAHISERRDSFIYGLQLTPRDGEVDPPYRQLLELIALGAALKPDKAAAPDKYGHLHERYVGEEFSQLDVWRDLAGQHVIGFDLRLNSCRVRGLVGQVGLEYLLNAEDGTPHPASPEQHAEIKRLFHWVVPNIATAVPADVREFLGKYAT